MRTLTPTIKMCLKPTTPALPPTQPNNSRCNWRSIFIITTIIITTITTDIIVSSRAPISIIITTTIITITTMGVSAFTFADTAQYSA